MHRRQRERQRGDVAGVGALKDFLSISTVLMNLVVVLMSLMCLSNEFDMSEIVTRVRCWCCPLRFCWVSGLASSLVSSQKQTLQVLTFPCAKSLKPRSSPRTQESVTVFALVYLSTFFPVVSLGIADLDAHSSCGMFRVALVALANLAH